MTPSQFPRLGVSVEAWHVPIETGKFGVRDILTFENSQGREDFSIVALMNGSKNGSICRLLYVTSMDSTPTYRAMQRDKNRTQILL